MRTSSSARTARTASCGGSATSARRCGPRARSTSGSGPTTSSTRSRSPSARPSTGSSTRTRIRTTSGCRRSSSSARSRCGARPGLDEMDEQESLAFCEQLFANELRGRELYSNRSLWLDFPKVTNATWHAGNLVILGDAAHTAHFSIGSGTKLAMEDSISLAAALARRRWDLAAAFVDYELEREPYVRAHAGRGQRERRVLRADRELFAPRADPVRVQPDHARAAGSRTRRSACATRSSRARWMRGSAGAPSLRRRRSRRSSCAACGSRTASSSSRALSQSARRGACLRRPLRRPEGKILLRLSHAGRRGATQPRSRGVDLPLADGWPVVAPTKRPYGPFGAIPGRPDEDAVLDAFVAAARGRRADVLEIDMAHGYLLGSYLSPLTNDEDDRLRFPLRVLEAVRAAWEGPLAVRLSVTDWHPRGNTVDDGIAIARALARARLRPDPRRGRPDDPRRPSAVPARVPDRAQRPRPQRGARPDARRRLPDDARRGEHDRRRRPRRPRPARPP